MRRGKQSGKKGKCQCNEWIWESSTAVAKAKKPKPRKKEDRQQIIKWLYNEFDFNRRQKYGTKNEEKE